MSVCAEQKPKPSPSASSSPSSAGQEGGGGVVVPGEVAACAVARIGLPVPKRKRSPDAEPRWPTAGAPRTAVLMARLPAGAEARAALCILRPLPAACLPPTGGLAPATLARGVPSGESSIAAEVAAAAAAADIVPNVALTALPPKREVPLLRKPRPALAEEDAPLAAPPPRSAEEPPPLPRIPPRRTGGFTPRHPPVPPTPPEPRLCGGVVPAPAPVESRNEVGNGGCGGEGVEGGG